MDLRCPDCRERFKLEEAEYDEGDLVNCPACNLELVIVSKGKRLAVKESREHFLEEEDEFGDTDDEDISGEETEVFE